MIRLRRPRRSFVIGAAALLAAAALVGVTMPEAAGSGNGSLFGYGDHLKRDSVVIVCAGPARIMPDTATFA
ncbi:hypothetical protein ACIP5Y_29765 [Nocardia sp. NPDC088792]|uniref:hypothetical protein n=1 Tax=Nocardia sp. NPDC088792 TaxID=3364332 RepID=UPI003826C01C